MLTSVKYTYEPGIFAWPIPFAYGDSSQVGARLIDATGMESQLVEGKDYQVSGANLIYVLPEGCALAIYLNAPVREALAANNQAALASLSGLASLAVGATARSVQASGSLQALACDDATGAATAQSGQTVQDAATGAQAEKLASLEAQLASLTEERDKALLAARAAAQDQQIQAVADTGQQAVSAIVEERDTAVLAVEMAHADAEDGINAAAARTEAARASAEKAAEKAELAGIYAENRTETAIARLEARIAELEERLAAGAAAQQQSLLNTASQGEMQIAAAARAASREAEARCKLSGEAWPQSGYLEVQEQYSAGAILSLPEPLRYYPGRQALHVFLNGDYLIPGKDFQEVGQTLSNSWRPLRELLTGDLLAFVIAPTNAGQAAALHAREAGRSAATAQGHAASAGRYVADCRSQVEEAGRQSAQAASHAARAAQSLELCEDERRAAHAHAEEAARNAWQASIASARPGIAAVRDEAQLSHVVEGLYIVNPNLCQTPTQFYGVWPVADIDAPILWDGLFFEGAAYEREPYAPPPAPPAPTPCPCLPEEEEKPETVPGSEWQPCDHIHRPCANCHRATGDHDVQ